MLRVGHNDVGYEPEKDPLIVGDLGMARQTLCNEFMGWILPVQVEDDPEFTPKEISTVIQRLSSLNPSSKFVVHGRVFWIQ